ncbi:MAG TPA: Yip1 family protein [Vicinamibacterales bacterium]
MSITQEVNTAAIQARATKILTDPKNEWPVIEREPTTVNQLYMGYIGPLAAVAAIAGFIGSSIIGTLGIFRTPITWGLIGACLTFVLTLVSVYISAIVISKLAPTFQSTPDDRQALKLVAYAYTPAWLAAVIGILPVIGLLASLIGGLYAIYLFYLGIPVMMKTPPDKVIPYMAISAVVIIVLWFVAAAITGAVIGGAALATAGATAF